MPNKSKSSISNQKRVKNEKESKKTKSISICFKHHFTNEEIKDLQENLLKWYDKEQRKLPWRDIAKTETDANIRGYAVWVSEIMLQQTQVATVIPYFNKWMKKWPTVKHLAAGKLEEVLQMWAGLGYYSRGRRLHEGAKIIMEKLGGNIPQVVPQLMKSIPGIGQYSASAIASVAFQKNVGVVDGNVIRVLSRIRLIGANVSHPGVRDHLWELANKIVSNKRPGDFNQALMELGAVVCTPQNPNCAKCPVSSCCAVYSLAEKSKLNGTLDSFVKNSSAKKKSSDDIPDIENVAGCNFCLPSSVWEQNPQVTAYPRKVEKKSAREEKVNVIVIKNKNKYFVVKRPEKGLLAGLWEFPSIVMPEVPSDSIDVNVFMKELGIPNCLLSSKQHVGEVIHLFSHIHTTYIVDYVVVNEPIKPSTSERETKWISEEDIKTEAISTAMKKVFALFRKLEDSPNKKPTNKKRKLTADSNQKSIKSFFRKS
ncbi:adenine DNA glycosylase [Parasteatoda tepidariorum]|uniref:adenine DNA glycosylase n=1 Tax=Parasteatoda tepidariorum TaxID=114398 RepID=UPI00077FA614|nr:adenine DNA glycosylase [Parasteatoda tepidariorum]